MGCMKTARAFRLSTEALQNLGRIQDRTGMTQTAIVENALAVLDSLLTPSPDPRIQRILDTMMEGDLLPRMAP